MEIKILGTGCPKCRALEKAVRNVISEMEIDAEVTKVDDIMKIMEYGVINTPGLVINGKVALAGRLPSQNEIKSLINQNQ